MGNLGTPPTFDKWPEMSFKPIEDIEIENFSTRVFYKSFFSALHFPEYICKTFYNIITEEID